MVVAQLAERSLAIPEVRSSNPVICNFLYLILLTVEKTKIKEKEAEDGPFFKLCL